MFSDKTITIEPNKFYKVDNITNKNYLLCGFKKEYPFCVNFLEIFANKNCPFAECVEIENNTFIFLLPQFRLETNFIAFKVLNKDFCLSVSNNLFLTIDGEVLLDKQLNAQLKFSHYEQIGEYCLIYLNGDKKFVIITKNNEMLFADFYSEINTENGNRIFLNRLNDSLNHGKVASLKNKKFETYLVYLDNNELKMKNDFTFLIFLDCFMAGNFNYCNNLLADDIKQKNVENIKLFFTSFDFYIPFNNIVFTFKKNTLAGVYKFELNNNRIENIIHLTQL